MINSKLCKKFRLKTVCLLTVSCFLFSGVVHPAASRSPSADDASQVLFQRMLQQTTAERDALAMKVSELEKSLEQSEKEKALLSKKFTSKESSLEKFKDANQEMSDLLQTMKTRMEELIEKFRLTAQTLQTTEEEKAGLEQLLTQREAEIRKHIENNMRLYSINMEVLDKYGNKGVWDALVQQEPMTKLKQVEIENIKEQYRVEIEQLKTDAGLASR